MAPGHSALADFQIDKEETMTAKGSIGHTAAEDCSDDLGGCPARPESDPDATLHAYFAYYGCGPQATMTRTEG